MNLKVKSVPVMVGGAITDPTSTSEPDVRISPHPAPENTGCCHTAPAVGAGVSTTATEPSDSCDLASALSEPNVRGTLRLHYVSDVCQRNAQELGRPESSCRKVGRLNETSSREAKNNRASDQLIVL